MIITLDTMFQDICGAYLDYSILVITTEFKQYVFISINIFQDFSIQMSLQLVNTSKKSLWGFFNDTYIKVPCHILNTREKRPIIWINFFSLIPSALFYRYVHFLRLKLCCKDILGANWSLLTHALCGLRHFFKLVHIF